MSPLTHAEIVRLKEHIDMLERERGESLPEHLLMRILADHIERLEDRVENLEGKLHDILGILREQ